MDPYLQHLLLERLASDDGPGEEAADIVLAASEGGAELQQTLDGRASRAPEVAGLSARSQLTCLSEYLRDDELAGEVAFTWSQLSEACHHRGYDVGPTADELRARFDVLERLVERLRVAAR